MFHVKTRRGEKFLLFTDEQLQVINASDCKQSKAAPPVRYDEKIDDKIVVCYACKEDYESNGTSYICTFSFEDEND